jgi:hypothetical protein
LPSFPSLVSFPSLDSFLKDAVRSPENILLRLSGECWTSTSNRTSSTSGIFSNQGYKRAWYAVVRDLGSYFKSPAIKSMRAFDVGSKMSCNDRAWTYS